MEVLLQSHESNLGVCELIFDFKEIFSYANCTDMSIQFLKTINEESVRTDDDLNKIMSSGMKLVNNILNGSDASSTQQQLSPTDERLGLNKIGRNSVVRSKYMKYSVVALSLPLTVNSLEK